MKLSQLRKIIIEEIENINGPSKKLKTITLDVAYDDDEIVDILNSYRNETGVKYKIITLDGSGGGWPEVQFSGTEEQIKKMLNIYTGDDVRQAEHLYNKYAK